MIDYEKIPLHWVNRLSFLIRKELSVLFREAGHSISPEEWAILLVLWKKGPQSPSTLANVTIKDRTTVTRLIDGMVRKNLVTRQEEANDRRRNVIAVSAHGAALKSELVPIAQKLIKQSFGGISNQDIETTTRTLQAMTENLLHPSAKPHDKKVP